MIIFTDKAHLQDHFLDLDSSAHLTPKPFLIINITFQTYLCSIFFLLVSSLCLSQQDPPVQSYEATQFKNKSIPLVLGDEIKKALSYYPELENTSIDFIFKKNIKNAVMQAQPRISTLFKKKSKRKYKIKISRYLILIDTVKAIEDVPTDILVGWIAHELGHIMDYINRSSFQMLSFGFRYVTSQSFLMRAERDADTFAISHGLADELIKTKNYILHRENLSDKYKRRIDRLYISAEEVRTIEEDLESF